MKLKGLEQIIKALKVNVPTAKVGVMGSKNVRNDGTTNAQVGAAHEFGTATIPQRSFLRVPIADHLEKKLENSGAFDKETLALVVKQGDARPWMKKVAITAEAIVQEAFETGGFGKWPPWKDPNYHNDDNRLLVDTRQLRESISSEVS